MKVLLFLGLVILTLVLAEHRSKRAAYDLPAGTAQLVFNGVYTTFVCEKDGYCADVENYCQIFHICHNVVKPDGKSEMLQWSFICGNKTVFNQFSLTCSDPADAVDCGRSKEFWYLNGNIGEDPNKPFHNDEDVARAAFLIPGRGPRPLYGDAPGPARPTPPTSFQG